MSLVDLFRPASAHSEFVEPVSADPVADELSGLHCELRVRRALSRLAAAKAAHRLTPGSVEHRDSLETAAYHADVAASLDDRINDLELYRDAAPEAEQDFAEDAPEIDDSVPMSEIMTATAAE